MKKLLVKEKMWAVGFKVGGRLRLYTGTWLTKRAAIKEFTAAKGWDWKRCQRHGDACVKITITSPGKS